jgi:hypothetical protein
MPTNDARVHLCTIIDRDQERHDTIVDTICYGSGQNDRNAWIPEGFCRRHKSISHKFIKRVETACYILSGTFIRRVQEKGAVGHQLCGSLQVDGIDTMSNFSKTKLAT